MPKVASNPFGLKVELNPEEGSVTVVVRKRDGEDFVEVDSETFRLDEVAEDLQANVSCYGLSKLLQDRTSDTDAGPEKLSAMREVKNNLAAGNWAKERVVGAPTVSAEVEALAQLKEISIPDAQRALKNYSAEQREKILGNAKVVELAKQIRASRAETAPVSLDDVL